MRWKPKSRQSDSGELDLQVWALEVCANLDHVDSGRLVRVAQWVQRRDEALLQPGLELAELLSSLRVDEESMVAALIYRGVRLQTFPRSKLRRAAGKEACSLAEAVAAMATTSLLEMSNSPLLESEQRDQVENIKRMLVAMIDDARVAVLKLAERVVALRNAKSYEDARRGRIAQEASFVFAPLAGRLGIGQLKWELEDLALRYTEPETYKNIARQLRSKRADREMQVAHMVDQVRGLLRGEGIDADVFGRAKHIYSIWRKMLSKQVSFDQVHDVRAVRVVVESMAECYAAVSAIHTRWPHIPSEFDDYIAMPKENGYRSIHTAVTMSDGANLEIQIRTRKMHADAELGVCAHWSYKGEAVNDQSYSAKMDWLRQVVEWHEELGGTERLSTLLQHRVSAERIYVSTPKGHVLDLPVGATALDFAYRVHTDVGHACRSAKVDGVGAGLHRVLSTGQQVEVHTELGARPRRDWLEPRLACIRSDRARAKIVSYFRGLDESRRESLGRACVRDAMDALGQPHWDDAELGPAVERLGYRTPEKLYLAIGVGEVAYIDVVEELMSTQAAREQLELPGAPSGAAPGPTRLRVTGDNRDGLLFDITQVMRDLQIALSGTTGRVSNTSGQAIITLDTELAGWGASLQLIRHITCIEGVHEVRTVRGNGHRAGDEE